MNATTMPPAPIWRLRFVDGAMRGRTIGLKPGANVLGAAGDCDILLPGAEVQPRHLRLVAGDVAVALQRIGDAPVRLNDAEVPGRSRGLVAGDRITLGGLEIELDRVADDAGFLDGPSMPSANATASALPRASRAWPLFAAGFAISIGLLWWTLGPAIARPSTAQDSGSARLQPLLADYPEMRLVQAADGTLRLEGFVESQLRMKMLEQALAPLGDKVRLRVQVVESLVEQARRFVADPAVAVNYAGQGRLVLSGATESTTVQQKIARLGEDMQPAVFVNDRVQYKPKAAEPGRDAQSLWTHWQGLLPARIVSITEGADGLRHIQLANGQRYYEGALLESGARLELIKPDELVISAERAP
jgi:Inner membrane component of T3SS, cytoplasmic domain